MRQSKFHRDREPTTDCCGAPFVHSDIDLCSKCYEHSSIHDIGFMDDPSDPYWKEVCSSFYHACGGINDLGDPEQVDALCKDYASHFEENNNDKET